PWRHPEPGGDPGRRPGRALADKSRVFAQAAYHTEGEDQVQQAQCSDQDDCCRQIHHQRSPSGSYASASYASASYSSLPATGPAKSSTIWSKKASTVASSRPAATATISPASSGAAGPGSRLAPPSPTTTSNNPLR